MHSSTSSSSFGAYDASAASRVGLPNSPEARGVRRLIVLLVAALVACIVCMEAGTRFAFSRVSRIERRIAGEHAEALAIRPDSSSRSVLLVGNSLLLLGVDNDLLRRSLPETVRAHRFVIESTYLFDWKFGLRRLFADGSRPSVVAVSVGETNILPANIRGEYSSYYLFRTSDLREIADSIGYDNTRLSNLYFARHSLFFAGRSGLRNFILNRVDRPYGDLLHTLGTGADRPAPSNRVETAAAERLNDMRELAATYGARLVLIVPPGFATHYESAVAKGAARAHVPVIAPVPQGAWGREMFSDGYHLNERGAREFTLLLARELPAIVSQTPDGRRIVSTAPVAP